MLGTYPNKMHPVAESSGCEPQPTAAMQFLLYIYFDANTILIEKSNVLSIGTLYRRKDY